MDTDLTVRKTLITWFCLVMCCVTFIGMEKLGWSQVWWQVTDQITVPIKRLIWKQESAVMKNFAWLGHWNEAQVELLKLRRLLIDQSNLLSELGSLREENGKLRMLLKIPLPGEWSFLPALIVGESGEKVVIDQGKNQGVHLGMMVVELLEEGEGTTVLVGKVSRVNQNQSGVDLIANDGVRIPVVLKKGNSGNVSGEGVLLWSQDSFIVEKLLPDEKISVGDVVVTRGDIFDDGSNFGWVAGIPIGLVTSVNFEQETDVYQKASVEWLTRIEDLDRVFVVTGL